MAHQTVDKSSLEFHPKAELRKFRANDLPDLFLSASAPYTPHNLSAFSSWVASYLTCWVEIHKGDQDTCQRLSDVLQKYYAVAAPLYSGNVEDTSAMVLTIFELWVACDKSATHICNLLLDYDHGLPIELLESLILPFGSQMERLDTVEKYLRERQKRAKFPSKFVLQVFGHELCFSVAYFNQSSLHQNLLREIERSAETARQQKR